MHVEWDPTNDVVLQEENAQLLVQYGILSRVDEPFNPIKAYNNSTPKNKRLDWHEGEVGDIYIHKTLLALQQELSLIQQKLSGMEELLQLMESVVPVSESLAELNYMADLFNDLHKAVSGHVHKVALAANAYIQKADLETDIGRSPRCADLCDLIYHLVMGTVLHLGQHEEQTIERLNNIKKVMYLRTEYLKRHKTAQIEE